jgi:endonuclease G
MQTDDELRKYLSLITRRQGGLEGLLEQVDRLQRRSTTEGFELAAAGGEPVKRAIGKMASGQEALSLDERFALEAIIDEELRPAFDIVDDAFVVDHPLWMHLGNDARIKTLIEERLPAIGRVELIGHRSLPYAGTGFVVGQDLLMTNRHVAEVFASGFGDRQLAFRPGLGAGVDFRREYGRPNGRVFEVKRVAMIHPYWDMALLQVPGISQGRKILELSVEDARDLVARQVALVGYPAFDRRNPTDVQNQVYRGRFGVKKLQPGELQGGYRTASFGKFVPAASHDCSSLGGTSGGALIDLESGAVLGLHFGGAYHERNYAVPSAALAADARVVDAGVRIVVGGSTVQNDWTDWWQRVDADETLASERRGAFTAGARHAQPAMTTTAAAPEVLITAAGGLVKLRVPGPVEVSMGSADFAHPLAHEDVLDGLKEPFHDDDYSNRAGFDSAFLGGDPALAVPLPTPTVPEVVAHTFDGEDILHYQNFSIVMHARRRLALFTASNISREPELRSPEPRRKYGRKELAGLSKNDQEKWFMDPRMDAEFQLPDVFFTKDRAAFDKGHLVRRDDVAWGGTYNELRRANGDSYHVTNCSPQVADFNRSNLGEDNWGDLENHVLKSAASERLCVFAGPILDKSDDVFVGVGNRGAIIRARIPGRYWKVIVACGEHGLQAFGFVLEQDLGAVEWEFMVPDEFVPVMYPIEEIEELTTLDFSDVIRQADQFDSVHGIELVMQGIRLRTH